MSSTIDPLTGLPMVFDNIIEQIPLDAQIFPYADLGATARPTAPPLYPDSIIPVSAFLSGQHPDTGSAQTVATNGDHDLRVHVTNAASGGSTSFEDANDLTEVNQYKDAFTTEVLWDLDPVDFAGEYFAGVTANVVVDDSVPPPASGYTHFHFYYSFTDASGFTVWLLHGAITYGIGGTGLGNTSWTGTFVPPVPIALNNGLTHSTSKCQFVYTSNGNINLRISYTFKLLKPH